MPITATTSTTSFIITLNQIVKLMKDFSTDHPQLNDFGFGQTSEIGTSRQMDMAYMWATFETDSLFSISPNKSIIPELNFTIIFADKVNNQVNFSNSVGEDSNNGLEVLSDMYQVAQDFIMTAVINWGQYGISIPSDVSVFPVQDETDDAVNGFGIRVTFRLKYLNCEIPI